MFHLCLRSWRGRPFHFTVGLFLWILASRAVSTSSRSAMIESVTKETSGANEITNDAVNFRFDPIVVINE